MANSGLQYQALSTREGFNRSLGHFRLVSGIIPDVEDHANLSDVLNELMEKKKVTALQVPAILNALLVDKYHYVGKSHNLAKSVSDLVPVAKETATWTAVDLVAVYYHPDLGMVVVNPKSPESWASVQELRRNELLTVYAGGFGDDGGPYAEAAEKLIDLVEGRKVKAPARFKGGSFKAPRPGARVLAAEPDEEPEEAAQAAPEKPRERTDILLNVPAAGSQAPAAPAVAAAPRATAAPPGPTAAQTAAKRKMTPMIGIPVTNELFHNGNVEAWKRIIQSYTTKYPHLEVYVFYDGERIQDINSLFKWGKVKHGSTILVAVAGDPSADVPKLKRYLGQGASSMYEAFLRFPVNTILPLF